MGEASVCQWCSEVVRGQMACHANTAYVRKYTKQNKQRKGKITSVAVVVSVKAEWDRVKRANGFSSNDEMIKCILGDLKRANVDSPKCCEPHNAMAVSRSVKEEWPNGTRSKEHTGTTTTARWPRTCCTSSTNAKSNVHRSVRSIRVVRTGGCDTWTRSLANTQILEDHHYCLSL